MAGEARTAPTLLVEIVRLPGEPESAVRQYVEGRASDLLRRSFSSVNLFHLRRQLVPAERIGDDVYLAAYQFDNPDALAAETRAAQAKEALPEGASMLDAAVYSKMVDYGEPDPAGDAGPPSAMIVFSHATDPAYDRLFNEWYTENHMIDVGKSPHFRSATRYRLRVQGEGAPLPYLCIYQIDHPYTDELYDWTMHWLADTPDDFRQPMPSTPGGVPVLTLDLWGYYQRVWAGTSK